MKMADMLLQAEHVGRYFDGRDVVFIGDGDAIGLSLVHLHKLQLLPRGPKSLVVLDFDERVVLSVAEFARQFDISDVISAQLYNVADPLPEQHWQRFTGFYTNPPFGASNGGRSVEAFLRRAFEAAAEGAIGCLVLADHDGHAWTHDVLHSTQKLVLDNGYMIRELLPHFHTYHLDDAPDLTSCSVVVQLRRFVKTHYRSQPLEAAMLKDFYGGHSPLRVKYVKDLTSGGKRASRDHELMPFSEALAP